jgi:MFS family permease
MMTKTNQSALVASPLYGWGTVLVLVAAYAVSLLDRQIVALLVEPVRADLGINDKQIGIVQGLAFGLCYATLGLPLGWMADRVHRLRLIAGGIIMWSLMTMACGLAQNFHQLLLARAGVGIGEAALVPASVSLLSDLFSAQRRALPMSVFTAGLSIGTGFSLIIGGSFVAYAQHGVENFPLIGAWLAQNHPWQTVFILSGLIGFPVAAIVLCLKEPARTSSPAITSSNPAGLTRYFRSHWRVLAPILGATTLLFVFSNANNGWMPSIFVRGFGWQAKDVGILGIPIALTSLVGNVGGGLLTNWLAKKGHANAPLLTMVLGAGVFVPITILAPLSPTAPIALFGVPLIYFGIALWAGIATTTYVGVVPAHMRGRIVALYLLLGNLIGLGLGPLVVGTLLDDVFQDRNMVGPSLSIVGAVFVLPAFLLLRSVRRRYAERALVINPELAQMPAN